MNTEIDIYNYPIDPALLPASPAPPTGATCRPRSARLCSRTDTVKEHPILFSAPMVLAILAGNKTQTRRIVTKHNSVLGSGTWPEDGLARAFPQADGSKLMLPGDGDTAHRLWPKWGPDDRLWVKETFSVSSGVEGTRYEGTLVPRYRADVTEDIAKTERWKPSIFMPRWASRITLEIVSVRVERLQDISDGDAIAEGIDIFEDGCGFSIPLKNGRLGSWQRNERDAFWALWELVNGADAWAQNPWVWVIEFRRVQP